MYKLKRKTSTRRATPVRLRLGVQTLQLISQLRDIGLNIDIMCVRTKRVRERTKASEPCAIDVSARTYVILPVSSECGPV